MTVLSPQDQPFYDLWQMEKQLSFTIVIPGQIPMGQSADGLYVIWVKEPLDSSWSEWLNDFTITRVENQGTSIAGIVKDQAALHGLLDKIRDLNLTLIGVHGLKSQSTKHIPNSPGSDIRSANLWLQPSFRATLYKPLHWRMQYLYNICAIYTHYST